MRKLMDRLYANIDEAKAFALRFANFAYFYDDWNPVESYTTVVCQMCQKEIQHSDYQMPRASAKKPTAILHSLDFGVSPELRDELIARFDITEADFRPIRTKRGEIVYYQITPQHVMRPLHNVNSWPVLKECPQCGHVYYEIIDRLNEQDEDYYYITQEALDDMHDLNVTFEHFRGDYPIFVISRRVYDYLTERFPGTHFYPFFLREKWDVQGIQKIWTWNKEETGMMKYDMEQGVLIPVPMPEKRKKRLRREMALNHPAE